MRNQRRSRHNPIVRSLQRIVQFFRKLFGLKQKHRPISLETQVLEELSIEPVIEPVAPVIEPVIPEPDFWASYEWARLGDLLTQINWQADSLEISPKIDRVQTTAPKNSHPQQNFDLVTLGELLADIEWHQTRTSVFTKAVVPERQAAFDPLLN